MTRRKDRIIISMLDDDLYKFTMQQAVFHQYGLGLQVEYIFTCRGPEDLGYLVPQLQEEINNLVNLRLSLEEAEYMRKQGIFKDDYIAYLLSYVYKPEQVILSVKNKKLNILIRGPWVETILWEVKLLAIISELHFRNTIETSGWEQIRDTRLFEKVIQINDVGLPLADFGTRRRYSRKNQEHVVGELAKNCRTFVGTSNVYLAMKYGIKPIGTVAHEWIMAHLGIVANIAEAQRRALYVWLQEYGNNLSIALTDTFTTKAFFQDFDPILAKTESGLRQDSDDPFVFGKKAAKFYESLNIDTQSKTVIFSDNLNVPKGVNLYQWFKGIFKVLIAIGTNLTNDVGVTPLKIVIKLMTCNGTPVVKISDDIGKEMGDAEMLTKVKQIYNIQ